MADHTSASTMRANQLRLWFTSFAYVLISALLRFGLAGTKLVIAAANECSSLQNWRITVAGVVVDR